MCGLCMVKDTKSARYCSGRLSDVKKLLFHVTLHIVVVRAETLEGGSHEFSCADGSATEMIRRARSCSVLP